MTSWLYVFLYIQTVLAAIILFVIKIPCFNLATYSLKRKLNDCEVTSQFWLHSSSWQTKRRRFWMDVWIIKWHLIMCLAHENECEGWVVIACQLQAVSQKRGINNQIQLADKNSDSGFDSDWRGWQVNCAQTVLAIRSLLYLGVQHKTVPFYFINECVKQRAVKKTGEEKAGPCFDRLWRCIILCTVENVITF